MQPPFLVRCLLCACALAAPTTAAVAQPLDFDCVMDPAADIHLGAATQGLLQEVLVSRGQTVTKGQIVARLWSDVETATLALLTLRAESDAAILARQAQVDFATDKVDRTRILVAQKSATASALKEAELDLATARAALKMAELDRDSARTEADRAREQVEQTNVRAPMDGYVEEILLHPGEFATPDHPILRLAQLDPLHVQAFLPAALYPQVTLGTKVRIRPESMTGADLVSEVTAIDHVLDTASLTFGIEADLPNPDGKLPAGQRCTLRLDPAP